MSDALLIAAHGSRDEAGVEELWELADAWQRLRPDRLQAAGFLEFARPTIGEAIDDLVGRGASRVVVVPAMLMAAGHVKNDVPSELHEGRLRHPAVTSVIIGPRTMEQLEDSLGAVDVAITDDEAAKIDELVPPGTSAL